MSKHVPTNDMFYETEGVDLNVGWVDFGRRGCSEATLI
jgi:hypothetical protein